jgi:membrane fusion protein (multidrug efflux system)
MKIDPPEDVNLLPGMTANVTVTVPGDDDRVTGTQAAMLPSTAVFSDDAGNPSVWVVDAETMQVSRRKVEVADMTGSEIRVLSGLQPGDRVAVSGVNNLREGLQVRELGN